MNIRRKFHITKIIFLTVIIWPYIHLRENCSSNIFLWYAR